MTKFIPLLAITLIAGCSDSPSQPRAAAASAEAISGRALYVVTVENLTSGQPLTPPAIATHRKPVALFEVGASASLALQQVAENGNLAPLLDTLGEDKHVDQIAVAIAGDPPPVLPGQSVSIEISGEQGAKYLSYVSMLICTNDGFTGVDGVRLPKKVGDLVEIETDAYDAGTEINTEDFADMVPPCPALTGVPSDEPGTGTSDPELAENGVIQHHDGVQGIADLSVEVHDWMDPVARLTVVRAQ